MIRAENLTLQRAHKTIIDDVDLVLQCGQVLGVLGTNGAGKSTLLAGLSGELTSTTGQVFLGDQLLESWPAMERAKHLAVLPQTASLSFNFLVSEVVSFGRLPHKTGLKKDQEIINEVLELTDISYLAKRNYLELSGGERQRVHLSRVLAQLWPITERSVLLLDEPTSMLDPLHQHTLLKVVKYCAAQGAAVMIILHDLNLAACYCDQLILLEQGKIFTQGFPQQVLTQDNIKKIFGLDVLVQAHPLYGYPLVIAY